MSWALGDVDWRFSQTLLFIDNENTHLFFFLVWEGKLHAKENNFVTTALEGSFSVLSSK